MKTLVNALATVVRRWPWWVIIATLIVSFVAGNLGSQFVPAEDQNESFAPEAAELTAIEEIGELFGATVARMQVLTSSTTGDVITLDGLNAAISLEQTVRADAEASEILADSPNQPAIISYMAPVLFAVDGGAPFPTSDEEVTALYTAGLEQTPPEFQAFLLALLSTNSDPAAATAEYGLSAIAYESSDNFDVQAERATVIGDAVIAAPTPESITNEAFSVELIFASGEDFQEEILRLFASAGLIILLVLAIIFIVKPSDVRQRSLLYGGLVLMAIGAMIAVVPGLVLILPDLFPEAWQNAELGPVLLSALTLYAIAFLLWTIGSRKTRRTAADTLLTFVTIGLAIQVMNAYGFVRFEDQSQMAQILPILLIGLGVDYSIHMNTRYRQELDHNSVDDSMRRAIRTVGVALVLATLTTAVGFLTNVTNDIPALAEFGELAAVGIAASFLLMLTFVPAVRLLMDRTAEARTASDVPDSPALPRLLSLEGSHGRAQWWKVQFLAIGVYAAGAIAAIAAIQILEPAPVFGAVFFLVAAAFLVLEIWIWIANGAKRFHDRGKSAWWLLIVFIPVIGAIWLIVELGFLRGTEGAYEGSTDYAMPTLSTDGLGGGEARTLPRLIGKAAVLPRTFAAGTVILAVVFTGIGAYGMTNLSTEFSFLDFVPTTSPLRDTAVTVDEEFDFPETTSVLVTGDVSTGAAWNTQLESFNNAAEVPDVSFIETPNGLKVPTGQTFMGVMFAFLNPGAPTFDQDVFNAALQVGFTQERTVPNDTDISPMLDVAYEKYPELMAGVLSRDDSGAYIATLYNFDTTAGESRAAELADGLNAAFAPVADAGLEAIATSTFIINNLVVDTLSNSQVSSLLLTMGAALLLLVVNFWFESRRPMLGVITTLPVVMVVVWVFGLMAGFGIPFGPVTATISALGIGIGIPYMIHVTHRYLEERIERDDADEAMTETLTHTGGALAGSAVTTIAGFGILMISTTIPFRQFGFVIAYTILLALIAAVLVLPSMLAIWDRWHRKRGDDTLDVEVVEAALGE